MIPKLLIAPLIGLPLMCAELQIDHVTVAGRDLAAMRRALESAGVPSEYGGPHANHATEMALTSFPDGSYLELIALQPHASAAGVAASPWRTFLEGDGGPSAWATRPPDFAAEIERLEKAGSPVSKPARNGRRRPDGVELAWETAQVGSGNGNFFPFLIHDFTPRDRRAYPGGRPTTSDFRGIAKVVLAVNDLPAAIAQFQKVYGFPAPRVQEDSRFGAKLALFAGTPVVIASPLESQSWIAERLRRFGQAPCAFVLELAGRPKLRLDTTPSHWFGKIVSWAAPGVLGWRLGVE